MDYWANPGQHSCFCKLLQLKESYRPDLALHITEFYLPKVLQGDAIACHSGVSHFGWWEVLQMQVPYLLIRTTLQKQTARHGYLLDLLNGSLLTYRIWLSEKWVGSMTRSPRIKHLDPFSAPMSDKIVCTEPKKHIYCFFFLYITAPLFNLIEPFFMVPWSHFSWRGGLFVILS